LPSPMLILFEPTKATFLILPSDEIFFKLSAIPFISTKVTVNDETDL
jgi:hypothetical protein